MPDWLETLIQSWFLLGGGTALIIALALWYLFGRQPKTFKAFDSEGGEVHVTRRAVRELVKRCCEGIPDIGAARTRVDIRGQHAHVTVELRVRKNANLKNITGYLREQIGAVLTENLGIEEIGEIRIIVVGVLDEPDPDEA
ncbi:MAG: hypothetical protein D6781_03290 [Verrucomicrobia bacterium]|nr:MAG: hypothetical protein D6781_03290 [Verrucomicrobiota bacterium]